VLVRGERVGLNDIRWEYIWLNFIKMLESVKVGQEKGRR
jgi:hypothetical protein